MFADAFTSLLCVSLSHFSILFNKKTFLLWWVFEYKAKVNFSVTMHELQHTRYNEKYETGLVLLWVCGQERKKEEKKTGGLIVIKGPQSHVGLFHLLSYTCGTSGLYTHTHK